MVLNKKIIQTWINNAPDEEPHIYIAIEAYKLGVKDCSHLIKLNFNSNKK